MSKKNPNRWTDQDRQAFRDGNRLRATTVPNKKRKASRDACRKGKWG